MYIIIDNTIFIITTDGMENASHRYASAEIKAKIKRQTEKYGWEFIFLAANIDAVETAEISALRNIFRTWDMDARRAVYSGLYRWSLPAVPETLA